MLFRSFVVLIVLSLMSVAAQERWSFEPGIDPLTDEALLDLRFLNEKAAGESGWVRLSPDGTEFVLGNGEPVRFWAVTTNRYFPKANASLDDMRRHAKAMAKRGVNMMRVHTTLADKKGNRPEDINEATLEGIHRLAAACREEGVYLTISPYWAHAARNWGKRFARDFDGENVNGLLFYHPRVQQAYKAHLRKLLTTKNPNTGKALKDDPTLAILQIQNEDSLLFWTVKNYSPQQKAILSGLFADWLKAKYGSLQKASKAWQGFSSKEDELDQGKVGLLHIWEMTQDQKDAGKDPRLSDQLAFFGETMRKWNAEVVRYVREELGCPVLVNAGNWRTADNERMLDAERWSQTSTQVAAVNRYFGAIHSGPQAGYRVKRGQHFKSRSAITSPHLLPHNLRQVVGMPMMITETLWSPPTLYQAEANLLAASYMSLAGVDVTYWFCSNSNLTDWSVPSRGKWFLGSPTMLGQFPAAALLYRRNYLKQGRAVIHEERKLDTIWQRKKPVLVEEAGFDPNRDDADNTTRGPGRSAVHPLAYLVGRVEVKYGGNPAETRVADLDKYIDMEKGKVTSITGQLVLNYKDGIFTCRSPKAQAAAGFLGKSQSIDLGDVTMRCKNDYASIMVVAMDNQPLSRSAKILVQIGTTAVPTGWTVAPVTFTPKKSKTEVKGHRIVSYGSAPWAVEKALIDLEIANSELKEMVPLTPNGYARPAQPLKRVAGKVQLTVPKDCLYFILH